MSSLLKHYYLQSMGINIWLSRKKADTSDIKIIIIVETVKQDLEEGLISRDEQQLLQNMLAAIDITAAEISLDLYIKDSMHINDSYQSNLRSKIKTINPSLILVLGLSAGHFLINQDISPDESEQQPLASGFSLPNDSSLDSFGEIMTESKKRYVYAEIPLVISYSLSDLLNNTLTKKDVYADLLHVKTIMHQ